MVLEARSAVPGRGTDGARRTLACLLDTTGEQLELCLAQAELEGRPYSGRDGDTNGARPGCHLLYRTAIPIVDIYRWWFGTKPVSH